MSSARIFGSSVIEKVNRLLRSKYSAGGLSRQKLMQCISLSGNKVIPSLLCDLDLALRDRRRCLGEGLEKDE